MNELERKKILDCLIEHQPIEVLERRLFADMYAKQPNSVIPFLIGKYLNSNGPLGDLAKDCVEDGAIGPYIKDGLEPDRFFNYVASVCCDDCFKNALEPLRKEYNNMVGNQPRWRLVKNRGERTYDYCWWFDYRIAAKSSNVEEYYEKWLAPYDKK